MSIDISRIRNITIVIVDNEETAITESAKR